ncbi:MAG: hypothetical protein GY847_06875, partial [Proteobacteria bacterium]|nr:hypothetical protein [Pseudomonadota bacterium]
FELSRDGRFLPGEALRLALDTGASDGYYDYEGQECGQATVVVHSGSGLGVREPSWRRRSIKPPSNKANCRSVVK